MNYDVRNWFWIVGEDTLRAWSSASGCYVQQWHGGRVTKIANEVELSDVLRPYGLAVPKPSPLDIKKEYQKRLLVAIGADDLAHAGFIRADDVAELAALRAVESPTDADSARIAELAAKESAIALLIERYNAIPDDAIPADYADDRHWE